MKDNNELKLTDEEIIKFLKEGPLSDFDRAVIDLIERQRREIEKYKQEQNEMAAMFDQLGVILFGSREEWEKILIAHIDKQRKEDGKNG